MILRNLLLVTSHLLTRTTRHSRAHSLIRHAIMEDPKHLISLHVVLIEICK